VRGSIHVTLFLPTGPSGFQPLGSFVSSPEQSAIRLVFAARRGCRMETAHDPDSETGQNKYQQTTIGDLRKIYGADFAKGCEDDEKIADVLRKQPSLRSVIRYHEKKLFQQI
jgi:hypothetical protein